MTQDDRPKLARGQPGREAGRQRGEARAALPREGTAGPSIAVIAGRVRDHAGLSPPAWVLAARLDDRMDALGVASLDDYLRALTEDEHELATLTESLRVGETRFFRHRAHVSALEKIVIPDLVARKHKAKRVRAWSAGAATGQEAYTLAILLAEAMPEAAGWDVRVVATDISDDALAVARAGIYPEAALEHVPDRLRARWFLPAPKKQITVAPALRHLVRFERQNLVDSPYPHHTDVVLCRNVLIYFDPEQRARTVEKLIDSLAPGGYLFLGYAESLRAFVKDGASALECLPGEEGPIYRRSIASHGAPRVARRDRRARHLPRPSRLAGESAARRGRSRSRQASPRRAWSSRSTAPTTTLLRSASGCAPPSPAPRPAWSSISIAPISWPTRSPRCSGAPVRLPAPPGWPSSCAPRVRSAPLAATPSPRGDRMTPTAGSVEGLWRFFVEDGTIAADRLHDGLRGDPPGELATLAHSLATLAYLMGVEEVGRLAHACERALAAIAMDAPVEDRDSLDSALDRAGATLVAAMHKLGKPDASGARVDPAPLDEARNAIEVALAGVHDPATEATPTGSQSSPQVVTPSTPGPPAAEGDRVWVPTVDEDMIDLFMDEANERLEGLSQKLLQLEARPGDIELLRDIFRDLHTVKGSSAMVGLRAMNRLAHAAEDLVGQIRDGTRRADRAAVDALLGSMDGLRAILAAAAQRSPIDLDLAPLIARVRDPAGGAAHASQALAVSGETVSSVHATSGSSTSSSAVLPKQTLRVDFDKLDLLLNLVGELVLSKAGLSTGISGLASLGRELESDRRIARRAAGVRNATSDQQIRFLGDELGRVERVFQEVAHDLDTSSNRLDRVSAELRDQVMKLRMVPIGGVFRKYHRTVRDLAHTLGKSVRLELAGEETELDKILVEQLDDPLMHLIRNSVDHGIEPPEARVAAGKDREGVVRLTAYHRGNQIVIEISDDGAGMDPVRLRAKAREKKLMTDDELATLDDAALLEVIFRPGFSTAAKVSEVSGRGVGMDVVKDTIVSRMKGTVEVLSEVGKGSTFTLRLPLTLAIIQVLLARCAGEVFALPLDVVTRTLTCAPGDVHLIYDREVLATGGEQVPLIRLAQVLELDELAAAPTDDRDDAHLHIALVDIIGKTYGLVCDRLLGKQEIVIKRLGDLLEDVPCAAGATLLGDHCALILDIPAVIARATTVVARVATLAAPAVHAPGKSLARVLLVEDSGHHPPRHAAHAGERRLLGQPGPRRRGGPRAGAAAALRSGLHRRHDAQHGRLRADPRAPRQSAPPRHADHHGHQPRREDRSRARLRRGRRRVHHQAARSPGPPEGRLQAPAPEAGMSERSRRSERAEQP